MPRLRLSMLALVAALAGCDMLGIESTTQLAAKREADGKAVGGACRHAGRAIEDCYSFNRKVDKAPIYAGWREMDDYMRENKLEIVPAQYSPGALASAQGADAAGAHDDAAAADAHAGDKPAKPVGKGVDKVADKVADKPAAKPAAATSHHES